MPGIFAIFNFFSVWYYGVAGYLEPIPQLYEAFALVALYYYLVALVTPYEERREEFFAGLERKKKYDDPMSKHSGGSLKWFWGIHIRVFQILPSHFATTVAKEILTGTECPLTNSYQTAHTILNVIESVTTIICIFGIIAFYNRLQPSLKPHHVISKLVSFKTIVGIILLQSSIITGLAEHSIIKATKYASVVDLDIGLLPFITCLEVLIFSAIFLWAFSAKPYRRGGNRAGLQRLESVGIIAPEQHPEAGSVATVKEPLGVVRALVDVLNIWDILSGIWLIPRYVSAASKE
ncbi:hypothetical protein MMC09_004752 [Bachmanniomyces sp. S44760]|nr:hypothetical protein [Bachmanniomyces sp. S44760]